MGATAPIGLVKMVARATISASAELLVQIFFLGCSRIATFGKAHGCTAKTEKGEICKPNRRWSDVDTSRAPVGMIINSRELRDAGFKLKEVLKCFLQHLT
jgi:hypothetical protein